MPTTIYPSSLGSTGCNGFGTCGGVSLSALQSDDAATATSSGGPNGCDVPLVFVATNPCASGAPIITSARLELMNVQISQNQDDFVTVGMTTSPCGGAQYAGGPSYHDDIVGAQLLAQGLQVISLPGLTWAQLSSGALQVTIGNLNASPNSNLPWIGQYARIVFEHACVTSGPDYSTSTKTGSPTPVTPGQTVTYTVVVNNTGIAAGTPTIADPLALLDNPTWNVIASGNGATLTPPNGTGAINAVAAMPPASTLTIQATGPVKAGAQPGTVTNTATIDGVAVSDAGIEVRIPPTVTKTPRTCDVNAGDSVVWDLVVVNPNPTPLTTGVSDPIPAWVAARMLSAASGSAGVTGLSVPPATGWTGDANVTIPAGGWAHWTISDLSSAGAVGKLTNRATITPSGGTAIDVDGCVTINAPLPTAPEPVKPCWCEPLSVRAACCTWTATGGEAVLYLRIASGSEPLRNLRVQLWENPQNRPCPSTSQEDWDWWACRDTCAEIEIPYLEAGAVLELDGETESMTVRCNGITSDAGPWVYGSGTSRFRWPRFGCASVCACVLLDAGNSADDARVTIDFRERYPV